MLAHPFAFSLTSHLHRKLTWPRSKRRSRLAIVVSSTMTTIIC